jgi:ceramide glucosyltransferase
MTISIWIAGIMVGAATAVHIASLLMVARRARRAVRRTDAPSRAEHCPGVSVVRPVCGIDNYLDDTLRSAFELDYPRYEIIFCVALANDPVVPVVTQLIAEHPGVPARLLVGNESISDNPKLNNVYKGWRAADYDWIVMADSNVLMPRDYIQRMLGAWRDDTGLVASPPVGCRPDGFWAELECAFLNTYQARWQLTADAIGFGFAQGKSMLYRRSLIDGAGGIRLLGSEPAEDAATTKLVRGAGLRVRVVDAPFAQPLGYRGAREVWQRQLRWARLRTASFKTWYLAELPAGAILPLAATAFLVTALGLPLATVLGLAVVWYGAEAMLAYVAGWHLAWRSPLAWILRDLMLPVLWVGGWLGTGVVWRGHHVSAVESSSTS